MEKKKKLTYSDIEDAYDYVNFPPDYTVHGVLSKSRGEIYYNSETADIYDIPEDVDGDDDYVGIPGKYDLGLGNQLAYEFTRENLPGEYPVVRIFFDHRGAYAKFRDYLSQRGLLDKWFEYQETKTKAALLKWCADNDIELDEDEE